MRKGYRSARAHQVTLLAAVGAIAAACSQNSETPSRSISGGGSSVVRGKFTEAEYGVRTSDRVAGLSGPVPKGGGSFKLGSPYSVAGRWYVPREEPGYDRQGRASWYGDDFHGRKTANGEVFDMRALTAAHPTLPLPSYAYVTNLENGRTILVRVNDRGPYSNDRILDMSHTAARALGYEDKGLARVRVKYAGRAPLNGDDRRERQFLAEQPWNRGAGSPVVALVRPQNAPLAPPQQFPAGTPGRWSPAAYRSQLAGKDAPPAPVKYQRQASLVQTSGLPPLGAERSSLGALSPGAPPAAQAPAYSRNAPGLNWLASPRPGPQDAYRPELLAETSVAAANGSRAFVQVGVFRDRGNAEKLRRDLATLGAVELTPVANGTSGEFYRVRLGPMNAVDANQTLAEVTQRGISGGRVILE